MYYVLIGFDIACITSRYVPSAWSRPLKPYAAYSTFIIAFCMGVFEMRLQFTWVCEFFMANFAWEYPFGILFAQLFVYLLVLCCSDSLSAIFTRKGFWVRGYMISHLARRIRNVIASRKGAVIFLPGMIITSMCIQTIHWHNPITLFACHFFRLFIVSGVFFFNMLQVCILAG